MNWVHALIERARHARRGPSARLLRALGDAGNGFAEGIEQARRRRVTPSGLIAGVDPQMSAEERAYVLSGIIGRQPHELLTGLHGPSVAPPVPVSRFVDLEPHCSCWPDGECCSCRQGQFTVTTHGDIYGPEGSVRWNSAMESARQIRAFIADERRVQRQEYVGTWTAPEEPTGRRAEELDHHARERRRFSERPSIDPFPSRRGTW